VKGDYGYVIGVGHLETVKSDTRKILRFGGRFIIIIVTATPTRFVLTFDMSCY
jgi:hypothetical protein